MKMNIEQAKLVLFSVLRTEAETTNDTSLFTAFNQLMNE